MAKFHKFVIVDENGVQEEISPDNWDKSKILQKGGKYELLRSFVRNELSENPPKGKPRHVEMMRKLELVDYCPESDVGHLKWYPKGMNIFDLILDYALFHIALPWGAFKMKNPIMYRENVEEIAKLMGEFHERDYGLEVDKQQFILRFAADPGGFPYMQKVLFSHKQLPVKNYEEAICFRKEQKGEVVGLKRVRNFNMTDMHAFCADEKMAKAEYEKLCHKFKELMNDVIARDNWVLGWEVVEEYWDNWGEWFIKIIKEMKIPSFVKIMKRMSHYYAFKNEFQAIGVDGDNVQISTVQYDIKDGERFNISYVGEDNKKHPCIILHASSFGSIERALYAMLETAAKKELEGKNPLLPVWISPEQVRIIPIADRHLKHCEEMAKKMDNIRLGIDDRAERTGKKVAEAKKDWIPYIIVVGDNELKDDNYNVTIRAKNEDSKMSLKEFLSMIRAETEGKPFRPLYLPAKLSQRPIFVPWGER